MELFQRGQGRSWPGFHAEVHIAAITEHAGHRGVRGLDEHVGRRDVIEPVRRWLPVRDIHEPGALRHVTRGRAERGHDPIGTRDVRPCEPGPEVRQDFFPAGVSERLRDDGQLAEQAVRVRLEVERRTAYEGIERCTQRPGRGR
jgi:hypothetical protein